MGESDNNPADDHGTPISDSTNDRRDLLKLTVAAVAGATLPAAVGSGSAMAQSPSKSKIQTFLGSLYKEPPANMPATSDLAFARLLVRQDGIVVTGDQAIQSLMVNYVTSNPKNAEAGQKIAAALGGIKQRSVIPSLPHFLGQTSTH